MQKTNKTTIKPNSLKRELDFKTIHDHGCQKHSLTHMCCVVQTLKINSVLSIYLLGINS